MKHAGAILYFLLLAVLLTVGIFVIADQQNRATQNKEPGAKSESNRLALQFRVPEEILKGLARAGMGGGWTGEPDVDQPIVVDKSRIPDTVRQEAAGWITKTVRGGWLPPDLKESLIGVQRTVKMTSMSYRYDTFFAEMKIQGGFLRISEAGDSIGLLWYSPDIQAGPDPDKTVWRLLTSLLNLPPDKVAQYKVSLQEVKYNTKDSLYCGTVELPPDKNWKNPTGRGPANLERMPDIIFEEREWYQNFYVWLAPGFLSVFVEERVPGLEVPGAHINGPAPRFLKEPSEQNNPPDKTKEPGSPVDKSANP